MSGCAEEDVAVLGVGVKPNGVPGAAGPDVLAVACSPLQGSVRVEAADDGR